MTTKAIEPDDDTVMVGGESRLHFDMQRGNRYALQAPYEGPWFLSRGWNTPAVARTLSVTDAVLFVAEGRLP